MDFVNLDIVNVLFLIALFILSSLSLFVGLCSLKRMIVIINTDAIIYSGLLTVLLLMAAFTINFARAITASDPEGILLFFVAVIFAIVISGILFKGLKRSMTLFNISRPRLYETLFSVLREEGFEFKESRGRIATGSGNQTIHVLHNNQTKTANVSFFVNPRLRDRLKNELDKLQGEKCDSPNLIGSFFTIITSLLLWTILVVFVLFRFFQIFG